ncbi:hypothetical protein FA95DRAFT_1609149 [Auriscalpium vulgare]|uniref:Uncharacterized protein n=1 Tax=Auriscalpium vulgare TaxID=40419 RepID=A0ACB8RJ18_9AGAM|nr:hypothetical protein FA95DRAFT_1609149 [Auriscalpium vulgare]
MTFECSLGGVIGVGLFLNTSPEPLDPTLSAWLSNMQRLAALVERLHAVALAGPQQQQRALLQQVAVLRAMLKKQQARCIAFLQLAQEYADRYLRDISADIQAQHALLGVLERRLGAARELHAEVAALRRSFDDGTCGGLKDICAVATKMPFPEYEGLFEELERLMRTIRAAFKDLDRFWVGEVGRVTRALSKRRVEQEDVERWTEAEQGLQKALSFWEGHPQEELHPVPPSSVTFDRDLGITATILVPALFAAQSTLTSVRTCVAISLLTRTQTVAFLKASANLRSNEHGCFTVLKACMRYGETVVTGCAALLRMPPYVRVTDVGEMKERAREIVESGAVEAVPATKMGGKAYQRALVGAGIGIAGEFQSYLVPL